MSDFWVWFEDLMVFFPFTLFLVCFCFFSEIYSHICLVFWRWSSFFLQKSLFPYFWMKTVVISLSCKHVAFYMYLWETTSCTFCLFSRCCVDVSVVWWGWGMESRLTFYWLYQEGCGNLGSFPGLNLNTYVQSLLGMWHKPFVLVFSHVNWSDFWAGYFTGIWIGPLCCSGFNNLYILL